MKGGFGRKGLDDGKQVVKWIALIGISAFVIWFLAEGLGVIGNFM